MNNLNDLPVELQLEIIKNIIDSDCEEFYKLCNTNKYFSDLCKKYRKSLEPSLMACMIKNSSLKKEEKNIIVDALNTAHNLKFSDIKKILNSKYVSISEILLAASSDGNLNIIKFIIPFISDKQDINDSFYKAIQNNQLNIVKFFSKFMNVYFIFEGLKEAIIYKHDKIAKYLISISNLDDYIKDELLLTATNYSNLKILDYLLNKKDQRMILNLMHESILSNNEKVFEYLAKRFPQYLQFLDIENYRSFYF